MRRKVLAGALCCLGFWGWSYSGAQTILQSEPDPSYASEKIEIFLTGNPFTDSRSWSETIFCSDSGTFMLEADLAEPSLLTISTGAHLASLYAEPGRDYQIKLPPRPALSYKDRISPYFSPLRIPLKPLNQQEDINHEIFRFDSLFAEANKKVIMDRRMGEFGRFDSIICDLRSGFQEGINNWFDAYRQYRCGILALNAGAMGLEDVSRTYLGQEVDEHNPAYMELSSVMFRDFLVYFEQTKQGEGIRYHINRSHSLDSLRAIISVHPAISSPALCDLVLLQELPDMYYSGNYHKEAILILLDSLVKTAVNPAFRGYASEIWDRLSSLTPGHNPPAFQLEALDGKSYGPEDFIGKYTYLIFCTPDYYACMMEYPFLQSYLPKHSEYFEPVCVMLAENMEEVHSFMDRNNYSFKTLYYGDQNALLDNYMVKAFPLAYLLGPDGKLILSPAPLPSDKLEQRLFHIMRSRGDI